MKLTKMNGDTFRELLGDMIYPDTSEETYCKRTAQAADKLIAHYDAVERDFNALRAQLEKAPATWKGDCGQDFCDGDCDKVDIEEYVEWYAATTKLLKGE